ncbi:hypothetical protein ACLB2K_024642 [Fragaria x ananassa]
MQNLATGKRAVFMFHLLSFQQYFIHQGNTSLDWNLQQHSKLVGKKYTLQVSKRAVVGVILELDGGVDIGFSDLFLVHNFSAAEASDNDLDIDQELGT